MVSMALDMALHAAVGLCADRLIGLGAVLVMARTNLKAFPVTLTLTFVGLNPNPNPSPTRWSSWRRHSCSSPLRPLTSRPSSV